MTKKVSSRIDLNTGKDIDNVAAEITENLQILHTDQTRIPLNEATEHYINLNRLLEEGEEVVLDLKNLMVFLPEVVEAFMEEGENMKDSGGPLLERATAAGDVDLVGPTDVRHYDAFRDNPKTGRKGMDVYDAFKLLRKRVDLLFGTVKKDMGHQQVTPISIQLALVAEALQKLEDELSKVAKTKAGAGRVTVEGKVTDKTAQALKRAKIKTVADIRKRKKAIQKLMVGFELMQNVPYVKGMKASRTPFKDLIDSYNELQKLGELDVQTMKDNIINTMKGEVRLEIRAESRAYNRTFKRHYERLMQTSAEKLLVKRQTESLKNYLSKVKIGDVKGSPSVENKIVKDITDIAKGKKVKASRSKATRTKKLKTGVKGKKISTSKLTKLQKAATKGIATKEIRLTGKGGKKSKTGRRQLDLAKIQIAINQKLPAEVRRNMGRPALINQTGRFSNSVRLTGLRQAPASVVADYTYQLNPYETFENNGVRQWPTGYNPKPLISKSIRNLAAAFIDQKFTLRRV